MAIFARRAQGVGVRQVMVRLEVSCIADELNPQPSKNAFIFFIIRRDDPSCGELKESSVQVLSRYLQRFRLVMKNKATPSKETTQVAAVRTVSTKSRRSLFGMKPSL